ncbi:MAG: DUF4956 domain-containing protein [Pseudobacteriovorax sp.]|nr:DUF4956 domain-containing protein [Pseudobacteriovorax sp.]
MDLVGQLSDLELESGIQGDIAGFAVTMVVAIGFGLLLYLLYNLYFQDNEPQDGSLARSLILLVPALSATFWMIQSSIILSLGLLGSLSFVRFRTPVKRAEDVTFIVIGISSAIACATYSYGIGATLIGILFIFTTVRNFWNINFLRPGRSAVVTFNTKKATTISQIKELFQQVGVQGEFVSSRTYDGITSYVFNAKHISRSGHDKLSVVLHSYDQNASFNIFYPNDRLGV